MKQQKDQIVCFPVTAAEAAAKRPTAPDNVNPVEYLNYLDDLACWIATRAERYSSGCLEE